LLCESFNADIAPNKGFKVVLKLIGLSKDNAMGFLLMTFRQT